MNLAGVQSIILLPSACYSLCYEVYFIENLLGNFSMLWLITHTQL